MKVLITGGAGFIGCNTANKLLNLGHEVTVLDNLSRVGSERNLNWLQQTSDFEFIKMDIRNFDDISSVCTKGQFDVLIHLAAQVAVTTSVLEPRNDFEINALGTFNLLEAIRMHSPHTIFLNASTNKVYGKLDNLPTRELKSRYEFKNQPLGVSEEQPLDFHSPYGCSKGAAEQYVLDYARIYGLKTVNFRQSCIYGYNQFGIEDQGWVAWFTIAHLLDKPITIYGNGKQIRDVLFIDDLIDCYLKAIENIELVAGHSFNIGGGSQNTLSLLEFISILEKISGKELQYFFSDWRPGDQPVYVSNIEKARKILGWHPRVDTLEGIKSLYKWVDENRNLFHPPV